MGNTVLRWAFVEVFLENRALKIYELKQTARYSWLKKHMCMYTLQTDIWEPTYIF